MGKRIFQYPEVTELAEDDYIMIDSEADDTRCILASKIAPSLMSKTVTERKVYSASEDGVKGYSSVNVKVPFTNITDLEGDIVTFDDGEDLPLASLKTTIVPNQSGSGDPSPTNIRPISGWSGANVSVCGVNILGGLPLAEEFEGAVGYSIDTTNKTFTYQRSKDEWIPNVKFKENTGYTFIVTYTGGRNNCWRVVYTDGTTGQIDLPQTSEKATYLITTPSNKTIKAFDVTWLVNSLVTVYYEESGIFEGTITRDDFEPYNGHTYTIQFKDGDNPLTVYGGTLNVVSGELTVDRVMKEVTSISSMGQSSGGLWYCTSNISDNPSVDGSNLISDYFKIGYGTVGCCYITGNGLILVFILPQDITTPADANSWCQTNKPHFVYELATPITYQLTPTQVKSLLGTNNVWGDCGKSLVSYQKTWVQPDFTPDNN